MEKTTHYELNQWAGEDRIMRVDFNADNEKLDAALYQNAQDLAAARSALESAITAEQTAREDGDATERQLWQAAVAAEQAARESADSTEKQQRQAADTAEQTARVNADNTEKQQRQAADTAEQTARANADAAIRQEMTSLGTAIRQELAAGDASVTAANPLVKLGSVVTSQAAAQIDLNISSIDFSKYAEVIIYASLNGSSGYTNLFFNGITGQNKYSAMGGSSREVLATISTSLSFVYPTHIFTSSLIYCKVQDQYCYVPNNTVLPSALKQLNFRCNTSGATFNAGCTISIYGVKKS